MAFSYNNHNNFEDTLPMLLTKARAISTVNSENLDQIKSRRGERVIIQRKFTLVPQRSSLLSMQNQEETKSIQSLHEKENNFHNSPNLSPNEKDFKNMCERVNQKFTGDDENNNNDVNNESHLTLVDNHTTTDINTIIDTWKYKGEDFQQEKIIFGNFIDRNLESFDHLNRIQHDYELLLEKYSRVLVDTPESRSAVECLLHNLELLQVAIGDIHIKTLDVNDPASTNHMVKSAIQDLSRILKLLQTQLPGFSVDLSQLGNEGKVWSLPDFQDCTNMSCHQMIQNAHEDSIWALRTFTLKGNQYLASSSVDTAVKIWDLRTNSIVSTINAHKANVKVLVYFEINGVPMMASGSYDKTIKIFNLYDNQVVEILSGHDHEIESLVIYEKDRKQILASGSMDGTIKLWDLDYLTLVATLKGHKSSISSLKIYYRDFKPYLASGSTDRSIKLWCLSDFVEIFSFGNNRIICSLTLIDHDDKKVLASGDSHGSIGLWNLENHRCIGKIYAHAEYVLSLEVIHCGGKACLASASLDKTIKIWDLNNLTQISSIKNDAGNLVLRAFENEGRPYIASGDESGNIKLWRSN